MNGFVDTVRRFTIPVVLLPLALPLVGQRIRLPGGITIGGPQQGRPDWPRSRPERPDPERVCPKTMEWMGVLQKEYPNVDLAHTPGNRLQQMAVPLFADDVFRKEFGVSYEKLSDAERRDFFRMHIIPCTNGRLYGSQGTALAVFNTPFMPGNVGMGPLAPGQLIPALGLLAASRATLQADEQALAGTPPSAATYDRAVALPAERKSDLARVWPSEKARFETVVKDAVARSVSVAVEAKLHPLLSAPASPEAAKQLQEAPQTFHALFAAMPPDQQAQLQTKLAERRMAVVRQLLPPQQARASSFPATRQGLDEGAVWFTEFSGVFLQPPASPEADAIAKDYLERREATLRRMEPQFRQKVETTQDAGVVAGLYDDVFRLPQDRETATWQEISTLRATRAKLLTDRAEQARRAQEEREDRAAAARGEIVLSSLKLSGVQNAAAFRALYAGKASEAGLSRSNFLFAKTFETYLINFGQVCQEALPRNRVQMTYQKCAYEVPYGYVQGWVVVQTGSECGRWDTMNYDPPAYADSRAYTAERGAEKFAEIALMQEGFKKVLANPLNPLGMLGDMVLSKQTIDHDVPALIEQNGCNSKALARLQENMTRLANDQDLLHLAGYVPDRTHTTQAADLDVGRLAADLVQADATGWMLNKYEGLNGAAVVGDPDSEGRPRRIHATYSQQGFSREGSVNIAFSEGVPTCLHFADAPATCKQADAAVVKQYRDGGYRRKGGH